MFRCVLVVLLTSGLATAAAAQTAATPTPPRVRRWLDVQNLHLTSRFRWVESNTDRLTSSTHQWQAQVRARFLLDPNARYSIHVGAFTGSQFVSGWNNTGGGLGEYSGAFNIKQLFVALEPVRGLEFQVGGLYPTRGESTEITAYDNDAYVVGQRVTLRRPEGALAQVAITVGHIGDYRTPNVFKRLDSLADINYGQLLAGMRVGPRVAVSADYTYEDGRDILREGVSIRLPDAARPFSAIKLEAYQRTSEATGQGFNAAGDLRVTSRFTVTAGVAHIDRRFAIPGYTSPNGDRYERGTRFYSQGTYALTRMLSIGWFQGEAFNIDYDIPNDHRWEAIVTINPTAVLKARRWF